MRKQDLLRGIFIALVLSKSISSFGKANVSLTATQLLINTVAVDSNTSLRKVRQIMAADSGRYVDWGALGFWYVCDRAGISYRYDADSMKLRCIYIGYNYWHAPAYRPSADMTGTLSYLGQPITPYNNLWTMLQRARGHAVSIAPNLYSIDATAGSCLMHLGWRRADCVPDHTRDGVAFTMQYKQKVAFCVIYTSRDTSQHPLVPTGIKGRLYLSGHLTSDSAYSEVDFLPESASGETDVASVSMRGDLEMAFDTHDTAELARLVDVYRDSLQHTGGVLRVKGHEHNYNESAINSEGYSLLADGNFAGATAIFRLNTLLYPHSYNAYDSYGEGLLDSGYPDRALDAYLSALIRNRYITYDEHSTWHSSYSYRKLILGR